MPKRKVYATGANTVVVKNIWVVYGKEREQCFAQEVKEGLFGGGCRCGCFECDPQLKLPGITTVPGEAEYRQ